MVTPNHPARPIALTIAGLMMIGCGQGSDSTTPNLGDGLPPEVVFGRLHQTDSRRAELALRTAQNLGRERVPDRAGHELGVRVAPGDDRVVFARERSPGDPDSRELYVSWVDGSQPELRLTANNDIDDDPCWSPDGDTILFSTTRQGDRRLYLCDPDGANPRTFLSANPGAQDRDPDWNPTTDRIAFSRWENNNRRIYLVWGDGTGLIPLTSGSPATDPDWGDREPTFSPDGLQVVFARVAADQAELVSVDLLTGAEQSLFVPQGLGGSVRTPRFSPAGDQIFCGIAEPELGRQGLRLTAMRADGSNPLLVEPGEQWRVAGIDLLSTLAALPAAEPMETVDIDAAEIQISSGSGVIGSSDNLRANDGLELILATSTFNNHEIASINCVFTLPAAVEDLLELHITVHARVSRSDPDTTLRIALHNPVEGRFDTVTEFPNPGTGERTLRCATQSLAHVSREGQIRVHVIGEISAGGIAELAVDQVQLQFVRRQTAP